jgi:hypothetical protein
MKLRRTLEAIKHPSRMVGKFTEDTKKMSPDLQKTFNNKRKYLLVMATSGDLKFTACIVTELVIAKRRSRAAMCKCGSAEGLSGTDGNVIRSPQISFTSFK